MFINYVECEICFRRRIGIIRVIESKLSDSNAKRANLSARKKERAKLPNYGDLDRGKRETHISEFLSHPSGFDAILNARALQSVQSLDFNTYRFVFFFLVFICKYFAAFNLCSIV